MPGGGGLREARKVSIALWLFWHWWRGSVLLLFNCSLQSDYLWEMELKINQMIGCGILKTTSNEAWMYHWIHHQNDIDVSFMVSSERLIMIWWQYDFVLTIWGFDTALWWFLNLNLHSDLCWYNICKTLYIWFLWQNTNRLNYFFGFYQEVEKNRIGIEGTSSKMR